MRTLLLITLVLCISAVYATRTEREYLKAWKDFTSKYGKTYNHNEVLNLFQIFKNNVDYVDNFNGEGKSFTVEINQYADLSNKEFQAHYMGLKTIDASKRNNDNVEELDGPTPLPAFWDWRAKGAVTHVKDQGHCGSCWSFSSTGATEGCHFVTNGTLISLSEQNLIDCSVVWGNEGCQGGLMDDAFQYMISNGGIDSELSYPYLAKDGKCNYNATACASAVNDYKDVNSGSESSLQKAVYMAPVAVAIDASLSSFQLYSGGVYYEAACSSTQLDHGVLAVGWGYDNSTKMDYWIVKNSWGIGWGQEGYIWMARNKSNNCGIATMASYPVGCTACIPDQKH